jgi:pilus assembly protein Flp/PilA
MRQLIASFLKNQAGATSIEYAIIAGGLSSKFTTINTSIK